MLYQVAYYNYLTENLIMFLNLSYIKYMCFLILLLQIFQIPKNFLSAFNILYAFYRTITGVGVCISTVIFSCFAGFFQINKNNTKKTDAIIINFINKLFDLALWRLILISFIIFRILYFIYDLSIYIFIILYPNLPLHIVLCFLILFLE